MKRLKKVTAIISGKLRTAYVVNNVHEEYEYIKTRHPKYKRHFQSLLEETDGRHYDRLLFWTGEGEAEKVMYFDINNFFGKE